MTSARRPSAHTPRAPRTPRTPYSPSRISRLLGFSALFSVGIASIGCMNACISTRDVIKVAKTDPMPTPEAKDSIRLALVGDTGKVHENLPDHDANNMQPIDAVHNAILLDEKQNGFDGIFGLGDLVYELGPECGRGSIQENGGEPARKLEGTIGRALRGFSAPVYLMLGNHEVGHVARNTKSEACILDYAGKQDELVFPDLFYPVDFGVAVVAVLDSNALNDDLSEAQAKMVKAAFAEADRRGAWKILMGHHVLRTYHDKEGEDVIFPWLRKYGIKPDLYVNGHAHFLQFGIYDGIPALTSGAGSKLRDRPMCDAQNTTGPTGQCGPNQLFGASVFGYATLQATQSELQLVVKQVPTSQVPLHPMAQGEDHVLFSWELPKPVQASEPTPAP